MARHGIKGLYHDYVIKVQGTKLFEGENKIFLTQEKKYGPAQFGPFANVMYDYIRFEGPPPTHKFVEDEFDDVEFLEYNLD